MMLLSRIWYLILALLLGAAVYVVMLAVGQYNRRNQVAMEETLKADSQVVSWAMQVDARRRLDVLLLASVDPALQKAIKGANGKDLKEIPVQSKDDAAKALRSFNDKAGDYKSDILFAVDRDGRLLAQLGYNESNASTEFELGGYPAVFDALHGFLRDDTWVWGGKIYRVVARPVEDEVGQPPLGAVVAMRLVDNTYAKEIGKRTRTNIAFFALGQRVSSAALEGSLDENSLEALGGDLKTLPDDKQFHDAGRTDVRPLAPGPEGDKGGVLYVRLPGDAWELYAGFAVARPRVAIAGPMGFIQGADDQDKKNVKFWVVALVVLGALAIGLLFSLLEHSMPVSEMARQAEKLKKGERDVLDIPRFRGGLRPIAADINLGIQRVVEKGGGQARKPADLESILGPVPAQPNMSAFSFPMADGSGVGPAPQQAGGFAPPPAGPPGPPGGARPGVPSGHASGAPAGFPSGNIPAPGPPGPPLPPPPAGPPGARPPVPPTQASRGAQAPPPGERGFLGSDRTMHMSPAGGPAPMQGNFGPPAGAPSNAAAGAASPNANKMNAHTAPQAFPQSAPAIPKPNAAKGEEEEATMVAQPAADLIAAASGSHAAASDPAAEWHAVYEAFIRTKRDCGEPTDGLTFEKFQQTLRKNRDALMQRHGCKRVKFSVYVKEGRASLKATPVRE
jgi:hypothetical protein